MFKRWNTVHIVLGLIFFAQSDVFEIQLCLYVISHLVFFLNGYKMFRPTIGYSLFSQSPFDGHLFPVFFPTSNKASFSKQFAASRSVCFSLGRALGRMALCIGDWCPVAPLRSCLRLHLDRPCDPAGVSPEACLMWKSVMADGREEPGCVPWVGDSNQC